MREELITLYERHSILKKILDLNDTVIKILMYFQFSD